MSESDRDTVPSANHLWRVTFGGFMLALLAGKVEDETGNSSLAYYCSAALLAVAAIATFIVKPPHRADEEHVRSPGR